MATKKLLTFELSESGDELNIHGDDNGLRELQQIISNLLSSKGPRPNHAHLMTPSWSGNELSEEPQAEGSTLLNKVTIRIW